MDQKKSLFLEEKYFERLADEEIINLFKKMQDGDELARDEIVNHHIGLVMWIVSKKFTFSKHDKMDLLGEGFIGLMKAVDSYNPALKIRFNSYAGVCIKNEILMFINRNKRHENLSSLDDEEKNLEFLSQLYARESEEECLDNIDYQILREMVNNLPEKDKQIVTLSFGLGEKIISQKEISKIIGCSQPYISRLKKRSLKKLQLKIESSKLIDV